MKIVIIAFLSLTLNNVYSQMSEQLVKPEFIKSNNVKSHTEIMIVGNTVDTLYTYFYDKNGFQIYHRYTGSKYVNGKLITTLSGLVEHFYNSDGLLSEIKNSNDSGDSLYNCIARKLYFYDSSGNLSKHIILQPCTGYQPKIINYYYENGLLKSEIAIWPPVRYNHDTIVIYNRDSIFYRYDELRLKKHQSNYANGILENSIVSDWRVNSDTCKFWGYDGKGDETYSGYNITDSLGRIIEIFFNEKGKRSTINWNYNSNNLLTEYREYKIYLDKSEYRRSIQYIYSYY